MEIILTPELEKLVSQKINSGRYNSASEVVQESLHKMFSEEESNRRFLSEERQRKIENLRQEIMKGVEQIRNGEGIVIDVDDLDSFADEIISRGMERRRSLGEN